MINLPFLRIIRARFRPPLLTCESVELSGLSFANLPFASSQDDRIVLDSRSGRGEFALAVSQRDGIVATCRDTPVATLVEMFFGAGKIESPKVFS